VLADLLATLVEVGLHLPKIVCVQKFVLQKKTNNK
jgi:hypothetical protein